MKRMIFVIFSVVAVSLMPLVSSGASFNAFTGISDVGKLGLVPTLKVPTTFDSAELELWFSYGFTENIDVQLNASTLVFSSDGVNWGGVYLLPRYDFGSVSILSYNILALGVGFDGAFSLDVQYHTEVGILPEVLSVEINVIGGIIPSFSVSAVFAPVVTIFDLLALYVEINPSFIPDFGVEFVPGVNIILGDYGELNISYSTENNIGVWYSISF